MRRRPPRSALFPYTTLFRSWSASASASSPRRTTARSWARRRATGRGSPPACSPRRATWAWFSASAPPARFSCSTAWLRRCSPRPASPSAAQPWPCSPATKLDHQRQPRLLARDLDCFARDAGVVAEAQHVVFAALDEEPVAEILDERAVRIAARDVGEEERAAGLEERPGVLDEVRRVLVAEVVEQAAGQDEVELQSVLRGLAHDFDGVAGAQMRAAVHVMQRARGGHERVVVAVVEP